MRFGDCGLEIKKKNLANYGNNCHKIYYTHSCFFLRMTHLNFSDPFTFYKVTLGLFLIHFERSQMACVVFLLLI